MINLSYHHPFDIAERMAFLDHLAYGRVMLGCGPGVLAPDIKLYGLDPVDLRPMMNESLDIILKLYREDGLVSYDGKYWQIKDMEIQVKPYQQPHLPIYMVSSGSGNSIRVAAEWGLGVISGSFTQPGAMEIGEQWLAYESQAKEAGYPANRDDWRISTSIYLADSMEEAIDDVSNGIMEEARGYFFNTGGKATYEAYPGQPTEDITLDQIIDKRKWIIGDPDYCVRRIKEVQKATGGFGGLLMVAVEWTSTQKWLRSLELFARYVIPQFNGSLRGIHSSYQRMVDDNRLGLLPVARSGTVPVDAGPSSRQ